MSKTILYVDDDFHLRKNIPSLLEHCGYTVIAATDGQDALDKIAAGTRFDVLITDLQMPRMAGDELVRILRSRGYDQPMIVVTGWVTIEQIEGAVLVKKPFKISELEAAFKAAA